ncbi:TetR/AcrR family transcriptional regulator [Leifsonia shinshuensis]|uniref:TetR/AcrR family transcriptional regulator n=1 Tax=Leifsonia shinshuensis TaxID=150026 RepID=UPI001F50945D|nr:TetR/AcrR family transcriptional regulator [Leifsonia shinshuensis]MCI0158259.1 TetR/AcrR family transcriptional regulator [Leifsonia shinshuensis]
MTDRTSAQERWAERVAALEKAAPGRTRKEPLSTERIVDVAFDIIESEGFDALTMRRIAVTLETGPASLYAHVRNKAQLDDLLIGRLCAAVPLPEPSAADWREQFFGVCRRLRDEYLRYPGISAAAFTAAPHSLETMRISEGLLSILLVAGVDPNRAAWTIDAAFLYVSAYSLEHSLRAQAEERDGEPARDAGELAERLRMLPPALFPNTVAHADSLTSGRGHERFDFTLDLLLRGVADGR